MSYKFGKIHKLVLLHSDLQWMLIEAFILVYDIKVLILMTLLYSYHNTETPWCMATYNMSHLLGL